MLGASLLAGLFIGSIFVVRLGDIYGRKKVLIPSILVSLVSLLLITYVNNLTSLVIFTFIFGIVAAPRYALAFVYANELTTQKHEALYSMLSMIVDSSTIIVIGIYFYFFKTMQPLLLASILITIVLVFVIVMFIPESPKFLYDKGRMDEFKESLIAIAKFNGKNITMEEIGELQK
jgi:MFS family permease